jgi:vesicle coat complex subunit
MLFLCLLSCGCAKTKSTEVLIDDLNSADQKDRLIAVRLLPQRKDGAGRIVPALIARLKDTHADIRWSAAIALGTFGDQAKDAIPALQAVLNDRDARVREAAAVALSRIDSERFPMSLKTRPSVGK